MVNPQYPRVLVYGAGLFLAAVVLAAEPDQETKLQFVDAESEKPLAAASIVIDAMNDGGKYGPFFWLASNPLEEPKRFDPPPGQPPLPVVWHRAVTDAAGVAVLPALDPKADMMVIHERGIACLRGEVRTSAAGPIAVKLFPWAALSGRLMVNGKPLAGATVVLERSGHRSGNIGNCFIMSIGFVRHGVSAVTDAEGRFAFERLFPTSAEGDNFPPYAYSDLQVNWQEETIPYLIKQVILSTDLPLKAGIQKSTYIGYDGYSDALMEANIGKVAVELQRVSLREGQHLEVELQGRERSVHKVTGRLVWEDGTPVHPTRDLPQKPYEQRLYFSFSQSGSGACPMVCADEMKEDGRFIVTLHIEGTWVIQQPFWERGPQDLAPHFTLPAKEEGSEEVTQVDVGDFVLKRK